MCNNREQTTSCASDHMPRGSRKGKDWGTGGAILEGHSLELGPGNVWDNARPKCRERTPPIMPRLRGSFLGRGGRQCSGRCEQDSGLSFG